MRFCNSTILASLTSKGACTAGGVGIERAGAGADIREGVIVVNGRYQKGFSCGSSVESVVEPELGRVTRSELADLLGGVRLGRAHLFGCLGVNGVELLPVGFHVRGTNVTA